MLLGLLMLLFPIAAFIITLPLSRGFKPNLRKIYRILGGVLVFLGPAVSFYLASYSGDQGGIAAYFVQMAVIVAYVALLIVLTTLNWLLGIKGAGKNSAD